jgi:hypothetical protein
MPKKIKSVKKSRSSKPKLSGMISLDELKLLLTEEQWEESKTKWELSDAKLRIRELEWQVANPDYHDEGFKMPVTDKIEVENWDWTQTQINNTINDIDKIGSFFMGITISTFAWWAGILTLLFIAVL